MSNDEIMARISWDISNAEEAIGPDGLAVLMSTALLRRLFPELTIADYASQPKIFGCPVKLVIRSDLWWVVGIERNVTEGES